jgi:hypothetical protein
MWKSYCGRIFCLENVEQQAVAKIQTANQSMERAAKRLSSLRSGKSTKRQIFAYNDLSFICHCLYDIKWWVNQRWLW